MPTENSQSQSTASARVNERIEQGAQRVEQGVQSATHAAIEQVRDVRERAESGLEQQRTQIASRVRRFSEVLRHTSDQLTREDEFAQNLLDNASDRVQRVAEYINNARLDEVARDVQTFARRQPAVFFGGAFLVGLALGRFAKSSAAPRSELSDREPYREELYDDEPELPQPVRTQTAQRAPSYDASSSSTSRSVPPTSSTSSSSSSSSSAPSSAFGSGGAASTGATGSGVRHAAPSASEPPKPQTGTASTQAQKTEPGQGTKS